MSQPRFGSANLPNGEKWELMKLSHAFPMHIHSLIYKHLTVTKL